VHWRCQIPGFDFEPGDKNPFVLRISCLNSVDTTTVLEISLSWFRSICSNGMMFGLGSNKLRKRHIRSLDPDDIVSFLQSEFEEARNKACTSTLRHPAREFTDFLSLSFGRLEPAC
jgi:hypothetical protein